MGWLNALFRRPGYATGRRRPLPTGVPALAVRGARLGVPHIPVAGELLHDAGYDRPKHLQRPRHTLPDAQTARLPVLAREQLGHQPRLHVPHVPGRMQDEGGEEAVWLRAVLLQTAAE